MESDTCLIIINTGRRSEHKIIKQVFPYFYIVIVIIIYRPAVIIISQALCNTDHIKSDGFFKEILHTVSQDHRQTRIEKCTFYSFGIIAFRISM